MRAFNDARDDSSVGVIILTGKVKFLELDVSFSLMVSILVDIWY